MIADVQGYAAETHHGYHHVLRWMRVLHTFGALQEMTAAEAQGYADNGWPRWVPVAEELGSLENGQDAPDEQVVAAVRGYAQETGKGFDHVLRWMRVLHTFGALQDMTAAEAQGYADNGWPRWVPVTAALAEMEAAASDPEPTPQPTPTPTPEPACALTAPSSVSALGIQMGAVVSWTVPEDQDGACEVSGFTISAVSDMGEIEARHPDPDARTFTLRGLDPGEYHFSVRIEYAEGTSDELVTAQANDVPDACITLAVKPFYRSAIGGKITSVNGTGCLAREELEVEFKRTQDDYWTTFGRFEYSLPSASDQPDFVFGGLEPYVSYDFRVAAYDASNDKYTSGDTSSTIVSDDPSATADANSPGNVRLYADNNGGAVVRWGEVTAPTGRTLSAYVVEWKTANGAAMTTEIPRSMENDSEFNRRWHRINGLTVGQAYTARMAARTHPDGDPANTSDAWSVPAPAVRIWSEPTQVWFTDHTPSHSFGRVFATTDFNKRWGTIECDLSSTNGEMNTINCPAGTLISDNIASGTVTVEATSTHNGVETSESTSVGEVGGPTGGFGVFASGGLNRLVVAWGTVGSSGIVGAIDAYVVQHRKQNNDGTWPDSWTDTVVTDTDARTTTVSTGVTPGTYQVRVRGRADGNDGDDMTTDTPRLGFTSEIVTVTTSTVHHLPPYRMTEVEVTPASQSLIVEWEPPVVDTQDFGGPRRSAVYAYKVRHREVGASSWTTSDTLYPRNTRRICRLDGICTNPRSYTIESLTGGSNYEVAVVAINANGMGEWSWDRGGHRPNN